METNELNKELICVQFPGIVKNEERAIECLGGIRNISEVLSQPNKKRLGVNYQPENPYMKKMFGDSKKTAGVLLKLKVKKTKCGDEIKREVVDTAILGKVKRIYKFDSMCDFQYLPIDTDVQNSKPRCLIDEVIPSGLDDISFLKEPSKLFVVPSNFTRSDRPINYAYTDKRYPDRKDENKEEEKDDLHSRRRSDRGLMVTRYMFNLTDNLPTEPAEIYLKNKATRLSICPQLQEEYDTIKKMFEERPIWSQNLLRYHTKIRLTNLKILLPCLAIYMKNGPWRMLWVRYGYDPRKEPGARIYQTLDFRLRHHAGVYAMVSTRDQILHSKKTDRVRPNPRDPDWDPSEIAEATVLFRPGMPPSQRQTFYQYCDVKLPEVEEIMNAPPPPGYLCHAKRGWMPLNADQICRDHIFQNVKQTLLASHSADWKLEQASSDDEDSKSDEEGTSANATEIDEPSTSNT